nr:hypothetical protein [Propionibacterium sp.]
MTPPPASHAALPAPTRRGRPRAPRALVAAGLAAAVLVLPACSQAPSPGPTTATSRGAGEVTGDWTAVGLFVDAVMAENRDAAARYVVPDSPAARYLRFQADFAGADPARSTPSPGTWAVNVDKHLGEVTLGVVGATPVVWTDWRFAPDGRILQWSTPVAGPLEDRLWTAEPVATSPAGTVRLVSAFVNDTSLSVVVEVAATGASQTIDCDATYAAPAPGAATPTAGASPATGEPGPQPADGCFGTARISAGATGRVALQFLDARLGGTLTYTLRDAAGAAQPARLSVR